MVWAVALQLQLGGPASLDLARPWQPPGPVLGDPRLALYRLASRLSRPWPPPPTGGGARSPAPNIAPVLQTAHVRPVAAGGDHRLDNGLLLRSDVHIMFDQGYLGVDPGYRLLVRPRLRQESGNGDQFYARAGTVIDLPEHRDEIFETSSPPLQVMTCSAGSLKNCRSACLCVARRQPNTRSTDKGGTSYSVAPLRGDDGDGLLCVFSANAWLGHANPCSRSPDTPVLAVLGRPWLNHSSTTPSNTAAMQLSARVEGLTLRPGQTRDPLGPPDSRSGISDRSPEPTGKIALHHA